MAPTYCRSGLQQLRCLADQYEDAIRNGQDPKSIEVWWESNSTSVQFHVGWSDKEKREKAMESKIMILHRN